MNNNNGDNDIEKGESVNGCGETCENENINNDE